MRNKNKKVYFVLILIVLFGISVGYAAINRTLSIIGSSVVEKNTWDVYFDTVRITDGSVAATVVPVASRNNPTIEFSVNLDLPGDFYEFTVDVKNSGSIDAMIESITKTPTLTSAQAKYLNYIIEYQNGEQITTKQLVKAQESVRLKIRVEYRMDLNAEDLPTTTETLNLGFTVNYVQADSTGISVKDNGVLNSGVKPVANGSLDAVGTIVTIGDQQFYTIGIEGENVKLLSMYNLYVGNECPTSSSSCTSYGEEATGKQDFTMLGYVLGQITRKGTTAFSSSSQKGTKYSDYNGSIVERYVNNYKVILEGEEYGIDVVEARLITKDELISDDIGCASSNYTCSDAPSWIYSTSYWSGSAGGDYSVWSVYSGGDFVTSGYSSDDYGVRPVIIISKDYFI